MGPFGPYRHQFLARMLLPSGRNRRPPEKDRSRCPGLCDRIPRVKTTLKIKLLPSPEQHAALLATMERFNAACDFIAEVAFQNQLASKFRLQKIVYYEVKERFGLTAQIVIRAIAKVVDAYKRDTSIRCSFKPHGAIVYDERVMSFRGLDAVNLWTTNEPVH